MEATPETARVADKPVLSLDRPLQMLEEGDVLHHVLRKNQHVRLCSREFIPGPVPIEWLDASQEEVWSGHRTRVPYTGGSTGGSREAGRLSVIKA
jgi:hypothetical protein